MTRPIRIISHRCRGFGERENSLAAFKRALASDVDGIEIDYRITKDRKLVVHHDASYRDALGWKHVIKDEPLLTALDNDRMSLDTALALFAKHGRGKFLDVDIKAHGEERQLVLLVKKHGLERQIVVVSWIGKSLEDVHRLAPEVRLSLSFAPKVWTSHHNGEPRGPAIRLPFLIRTERVPLATVNLCPLTKRTSPSASIIRRLQKRGLKVVVVNDDTVKENERLIRLGVHGTMTNDAPGLLRHVCGR